jgi:tetratricopeptide (TPR) repeat protein
MAEIYVNLGQENKALNIINDFFTDDRKKGSPLACLLTGRILISRNEMTQAESPFTQLGELDKDTVYPRLLLGEIYKRVGNNEQSEAHYQAAIDADPESSWPPYLLGLLHQRIGKPVLARANYEKAVERNPNLRIAVRSLAELYVGSLREHAVPSVSDETLVKTLMETLNTRFPDNLTLHVTLLDAVGQVFSERTQFDRAVEIFELIPGHVRDARPHVIYHYATALYGGASEARVEAQRLSGKTARQASQKAAEWTARSRRELQKAARWLRTLPTAEQVDQKLNEVLGEETLLQ